LEFFRTPRLLPILYPKLEWRIPTTEKILYLTFDDGPVPGPTEFVLETLHKASVKATFFCIGDNIKRNTTIYQKVLQGGHAIGNHTFNHLKGWETTTENYVNNVEQCEEQMGDMRGTKLFRPPYGRISRKQIQALANYRIIMWDVLTCDYRKTLSAERCLQGSINATRPGSIVVFHDSVKAERNMQFALPRYIEHFKANGFRFGLL
jgi:peptidoglycan-N-acetylglucosamine deacetylase